MEFYISVKEYLKTIIPYPLINFKRVLGKYLHTARLNFNVIISTPVYYIFIMKSNKYLLCRPRGGLNDMLNQLELCCRYSIKYHRKLYIDTSKSGFLDSLDNYFILPLYISAKKIDFIQYPASVYPGCLQNDIYNYESERIDYGYRIKNGPNLDFDFKKKYKEQYLVHEKEGGGKDSFYFLKRICLKEAIRSRIASIVNDLGDYAAVHIRNTDYQTDYQKFLMAIFNNLSFDKIVVCTDDYAVQQYSKSLFGEKLKIITEIPNLEGKPLHNNPSLDRYKTNIDALTDLFILVFSNKLYFKRTKNDLRFSGFSMLAMNLHKNKKLAKKLLQIH